MAQLSGSTPHTPFEDGRTYTAIKHGLLTPMSGGHFRVHDRHQDLFLFTDVMRICPECATYTIDLCEPGCWTCRDVDSLVDFIRAHAKRPEFAVEACGRPTCASRAGCLRDRLQEEQLTATNKTLRLDAVEYAAGKDLREPQARKLRYTAPQPALYLYFVRCGSAIKIGIANNIKSRMASIATYTPQPPRLENCIRTDIAADLEVLLHGKLAQFNTNGEWFMLPEAIELKVLNLHSDSDVLAFCDADL